MDGVSSRGQAREARRIWSACPGPELVAAGIVALAGETWKGSPLASSGALAVAQSKAPTTSGVEGASCGDEGLMKAVRPLGELCEHRYTPVARPPANSTAKSSKKRAVVPSSGLRAGPSVV